LAKTGTCPEIAKNVLAYIYIAKKFDANTRQENGQESQDLYHIIYSIKSQKPEYFNIPFAFV